MSESTFSVGLLPGKKLPRKSEGSVTSQPESKLSRRILNALRSEGAFAFKVLPSVEMMSGLPDVIGCYRGRFFALETKMPGKEKNVSPRQNYVISCIRRAGGFAQVVTSVDEGIAAMHECVNRTLP